jgi:hypothetical protein
LSAAVLTRLALADARSLGLGFGVDHSFSTVM